MRLANWYRKRKVLWKIFIPFFAITLLSSTIFTPFADAGAAGAATAVSCAMSCAGNPASMVPASSAATARALGTERMGWHEPARAAAKSNIDKEGPVLQIMGPGSGRSRLTADPPALPAAGAACARRSPSNQAVWLPYPGPSQSCARFSCRRSASWPGR